MPDLEKITGLFGRVGAWTQLRSSVLHSLQVYTCFAAPACWLAGALLFTGALTNILFWAGLVMFFLPIVNHVIWQCVNPDRLQSEKYQLQHEQLQLMMLQGRQSFSNVAPDMIEPVTNPELEQLTEGEEEEK